MSKQPKFSFHPSYHLASLESRTDWHSVRIHTLLQHPKKKQPSINAYLGARYSRSAESVLDIAREVMRRGTDPAKRLEAIFQNYGHKSVGDMADLFVCIENVPMITAMKLFYRNPVLAGQERSTRFQDFSDPKYVDLPAEVKDKSIRERYHQLIKKQLADYHQLLKPTKAALAKQFKIDQNNKREAGALQARTFDTARYLLPMGLNTSLGFVMSARNWSELIGQLKGSLNRIDQDMGQLLFDLLTGSVPGADKSKYIPEADGLIRHTEANQRRHQTVARTLDQLAAVFRRYGADRQFNRTQNASVRVGYSSNAIQHLLRHLQLIQSPLSRESRIVLSKSQLEKLGGIVFDSHNHQVGS